MGRVSKAVSAGRPLAVLAAVLAVAGGCAKPVETFKVHQPPPAPSNVKDSISGRVTYHDVGLASGYVRIFGADGESADGAIQMGGTYTVWNPPHGHVRITISSGPPAGLSKAPPATHSGNRLPERYADPETSGLALDFSGGKKTFNIGLTD